MRSMLIMEDPEGFFKVLTSAGVRSTGASVQSALQKLDLVGLTQQSEFDAVAEIFMKIRPTEGSSQIGTGVAGA